MNDPMTVADRAVERLWRLPWAGDEERLAITQLLLHHDVPDLVAQVRRLCDALEDVKADRAMLNQVARGGGW